MQKIRITIRLRLYATAAGIFLLLLTLGIITNYYVREAFGYEKLLGTTNEIKHLELQLSKAEKEFRNREVTRSQFFETKESKYLQDYDDKIQRVRELVLLLNNTRFIKQVGLGPKLLELDSMFVQYQKLVVDLVDIIYQKGFKDYGLVGRMRDQIHEVEANRYVKDNPTFVINMLMLRRHEKDYLLRKDLKYRDEFSERVLLFLQEINQVSDRSLGQEKKRMLRSLLTEYQRLFFLVIEKDVQIGLDDNLGLVKQLNDRITGIEQLVDSVKLMIDEQLNQEINKAFTTLFAVSVFLTVLIIYLLVNVSNHVLSYLSYLKKYIARLGKGELPGFIVAKKNDEISEMIESINILTANLKNTRDFAIEVGQGNLETQVNVFDNKGDLGGSLIEMRNRLYTVAREREQAELEGRQRAWITEGVAKFGSILRQNHLNLEDFTYDVLCNLTSYLEINFGAIYTINDEEKGDVHYQLRSSIAFGHKKDQNKRVEEGVDFVGQCTKEKRTIFIDDIPERSIVVPSEFGDYVPRSLLVVPLLMHNDACLGAIELASFTPFQEHQILLAERIASDVAITLATVKSNQQTRILLKRTQEQAEKLKERQHQIQSQKERIESSIRYALTIQNASLPPKRLLDEVFDDTFLVYRPKDVVSGDFYWFARMRDNNEQGRELLFVAAVDCTGHGVPGAFMSLIGSSSLNEIVNKGRITDPKMILELLNTRIVASLNQEVEGDMPSNDDGMDLCLVMIEKHENQQYNVTFSGAKRPLIYYSGIDGEVLTIKGDKRSIGGRRNTRNPVDFTNAELKLSKGDVLYLTTDGFADQNNFERQRFGTKRILNLLTNIGNQSLAEQERIINHELDVHKGNQEQRDDITMLGIKL